MPLNESDARPVPSSVLGKLMQVLLAFTVEETQLSFTDLRMRTGLSKATLGPSARLSEAPEDPSNMLSHRAE